MKIVITLGATCEDPVIFFSSFGKSQTRFCTRRPS